VAVGINSDAMGMDEGFAVALHGLELTVDVFGWRGSEIGDDLVVLIDDGDEAG